MDNNHPYIDIYNSKTMIVAIGKGAYEYLVDYSNYHLADIAYRKGIHIDFHFLDENSQHDWCSWNYLMPMFIGQILR